MAIIGNDIDRAVYFLERGELVAIPTETVYGLAGNALDPEVVLKIFEVKNRPSFDPLIVHIGSREEMHDLVMEVPDKAAILADRFWPGPLTLLLPRKKLIPDMVTSGLPTVAVRYPDHPLTGELLQRIDFPLAAPSANPFGYVSPTRANHVEEQLGKRIPYILDGGPCHIGIESTIIGFEEDLPVIYRLGGKTLESIREVVGEVEIKPHSSSKPSAPGMLQSHYAPGKPVRLGRWEDYSDRMDPLKTALIRFSELHEAFPPERQVVLSPACDLKEAARNLFSALRAFDNLPVDTIVAERVPDEGLGRAINDRLTRAAAS